MTAVPPVAFLVAVSVIERRAARRPRLIAREDGGAGEPSAPGTSTRTSTGQPITRDALRARLGVSNQAASGLLRQLSAAGSCPPAASRAA